MRTFAQLMLATATATIGLPIPAIAAGPEIYGFCTVRDIVFANETYTGKVYRTEIFSVPRTYDSEISMTPMVGGKESATLERWVGRKFGFRPDRTGDPRESQHYRIEAPLTENGAASLRTLHKAWDQFAFPNVALVRVPWIPMEATVVHDPAPLDRYQRDVSAAAAAAERSAAGARAAKLRIEQERAAHAAKVQARDAENERNQQAYREEYKRLTGRYPN